MVDINVLLGQGEIITRKQKCTLDFGFLNKADGTLYLTNRNLIFQVDYRFSEGLNLVLQGQKDVKIEFLHIPIDLVRGVEKKGQSIRVQTEGSLFQEVIGKTHLFAPDRKGRVFENGPEVFSFLMTFINKDVWINEILSLRDRTLEEISKMESQGLDISVDGIEGQGVREKIIIKEVVKVKCRYCGSLFDHTSDKCPTCNASQ